jgi:hypothetical protein
VFLCVCLCAPALGHCSVVGSTSFSTAVVAVDPSSMLSGMQVHVVEDGTVDLVADMSKGAVLQRWAPPPLLAGYHFQWL